MKIFFLPLLFVGCIPLSEENKSNNSTELKQDIVKTGSIIQHIEIKSLEKFENDTLAYLRENFVTNKAQFINQPFKVLVDKLNLPVVRYVPASADYPNLDKITGIYLKFETDATWLNKINSKKIPNVLLINFKQALNNEEVIKRMKKNDRFWGKGEADFYGDVIINDIKLIK